MGAVFFNILPGPVEIPRRTGMDQTAIARLVLIEKPAFFVGVNIAGKLAQNEIIDKGINIDILIVSLVPVIKRKEVIALDLLTPSLTWAKTTLAVVQLSASHNDWARFLPFCNGWNLDYLQKDEMYGYDTY